MHVDHLPALGWSLDADTCVERMDEAGIEKGVVMTIVDAPEVNPQALELIAEACAAHPGRLEAFARIHPWYGDESAALLERAFSEDFIEGVVARFGAERVLYASAFPRFDPRLELLRVSRAPGLDERARDAILGGSFARLAGLQ